MAFPLQRSFDDLGAPLFQVPFCVVDLETTGGSPADCAITEIGAVRYLGGEEVGCFHTLVDPGGPIPPFITVLTGITQAMVMQAPRIAAVLPAFLEFLGEAVLVGHNVRFDVSFLNAAAGDLGYEPLVNRRVDTAALARRLVRREVRSLKLSSLAAHFRSPVAPNHRALQDARATAHVFHCLLERAGTVGVTALEDLLQLPTARGAPHYRKIGLADALPRAPGVYLLQDRSGEVFYVGKARNLRTRVRSYFYGDERRSVVDMLRELHSVDYRVTATELEAEVTELRLIHHHRPRHNRRSKPPRSAHWVKLTEERYPRLSLVRSVRDDGGLYLGPFRSRRAAEVVMNAIWDAVPIRRCRGRPGTRDARCAPAQLGVARCPCDGTLEEDEYAVVVEVVRRGVEQEPALLLDPLAGKMLALVGSQRYEEAAWVRDRHRALARAIARRREWQTLARAGLVWAESTAGEGALVERARLVASWRDGEPPLAAAPVALEEPAPQVPPSVEVAEEAHLVWQWLTRRGTVLTEATGPLAMPAGAIPQLPRPG